MARGIPEDDPAPLDLRPPPPPSYTIRRRDRWGPMAWSADLTINGLDMGPVYGWTEAGCERKAERRLRRMIDAATRRRESTRTVTITDAEGDSP